MKEFGGKERFLVENFVQKKLYGKYKKILLKKKFVQYGANGVK